MSRKKNTLLNIAASMTKLILVTLLSLFVSREILNYYGSSVNGVIATATQTTILLQILEGGFTTASLVALFKPFVQKDFDGFNRILSITASAFKKIAVFALLAGLLISVVYPLCMKTSLEYWKCVLIFGMITVSAVLNFAFFQPRIIAFNVAQKEYVTQTVTLIFNTLSQLLMLGLVFLRRDVVWLRFSVMIMLAANGVCICLLAKREFPFLRLDVPCAGQKIRGTWDVMIGNVVAALYAAGPIFMIATIFGAVAASIYSVYHMFFAIISHTLFAIAIAPKSAFGQLMYDDNAGSREKFNDLFATFETAIIGIGTIAYMTAFVVVLPLLKLYTQKMSDAKSYISPFYALFFSLLGLTQIIHIPAGLLMQIGGRFKAIKKIQFVMLASMLAMGCAGAWLWGVRGMLCGIIAANCILACCEIGYAYKYILGGKLRSFLSKLLTIVSAGAALAAVETRFTPPLPTWISALGFAAAAAVLNALLIGLLAYILIPKGVVNMLSAKFHRRLSGA